MVACGQKESAEPKPAPSAEVPEQAPAASAAVIAKVKPKAAPKKDDGPRLYVKSRFAWVHPQPGSEGWIGYLWSGASVKLKKPEPFAGPGCTAWVAIEPRGYVCADGERATLDPKDPAYLVLAKYAPRLDTAWPHEYGESRGLIRYKTIPTPEEQRRREWDLVDHLAKVRAAEKGEARDPSLEGVDLTPAPETPITLGELPATSREPRDALATDLHRGVDCRDALRRARLVALRGHDVGAEGPRDGVPQGHLPRREARRRSQAALGVLSR